MPYAIILFAFLALGIPAWTLAMLSRFDVTGETAMMYFIVLYASFRLSSAVATRAARPITITFWLFVYIWSALTPLLQLASGIFPQAPQFAPDQHWIIIGLLGMALLAFELGTALAWRSERERAADHVVVLSQRWLIVFAVLAIGSTVFAVHKLGGVDLVTARRGEVEELLWQQGGETSLRLVYETLLRTPPFIMCMALFYLIYTQWRSLSVPRRFLYAVLIALILPLTFVANFPTALSRAWLGTVVLTMTFVVLAWRPVVTASLIAGLVLAFVLVFPSLSTYRLTERDVERLGPAYNEWSTPVEPLVRTTNYDAFLMFGNSVAYVKDHDVLYGRNLYGAAFFWFPRRYWPEKPIASGHLIGMYSGYENINLSAPLWMEAYMAYGIPGIVVLLGFYGFVTGKAEYRFAFAVQNGIGTALVRWLVPFWAGYQVYFLRGPLISAVAFCSVSLLLFLLLARLRRYPISIEALPHDVPLAPARGRIMG